MVNGHFKSVCTKKKCITGRKAIHVVHIDVIRLIFVYLLLILFVVLVSADYGINKAKARS